MASVVNGDLEKTWKIEQPLTNDSWVIISYDGLVSAAPFGDSATDWVIGNKSSAGLK